MPPGPDADAGRWVAVRPDRSDGDTSMIMTAVAPTGPVTGPQE